MSEWVEGGKGHSGSGEEDGVDMFEVLEFESWSRWFL
jgi:hypothetical protein